MRWHEAKRKTDRRKTWHLYFAWHPVTFEYGTYPERAWLEIVLRRLVGHIEGVPRFHYAPLEHRHKYPAQYGPGRAG